MIALALDVRGGTAVGLRGVPGYPLPELCATRRVFGVGCPGCGLTRSIVWLMHGDLSASLAMHRLGWLIFAAILLQIPYRALALAGRAPRWLEYAAQSEAVWATLAILLIVHRVVDWFGWL